MSSVHVRVPIDLRDEITAMARSEKRTRIAVLTRLLNLAIAIEKDRGVADG